ncbi:DUF2169 domain-containing protein [Rhizobiales bacterium RZME27]|uniref:DUF2169 domain-containing protein n=1 Tax=Endobacterium cereale TaxID=2663029 RepID=A0A6A8AFP2_9HYPH|nr:DUF2169 domain-containing protein [Endobacterium cereale]MQY49604.1 DUF2169 domain-containing protein [Endobacterium cereale]
MQLFNNTPFVNFRFYNSDSRGTEFGVLVVKGTYEIGKDGILTIADEQAPLVLSDRYCGAVNVSSLQIPSDLAPLKPRADVIVNAIARAPDGKPLTSWKCGVAVTGEHRLEKRLRVTGPRQWMPTFSVPDHVLADLDGVQRMKVFKGWRLTDPSPVSEVPLQFEHAYGGFRPKDDDAGITGEIEERNPIGCGLIETEMPVVDGPRKAPQIEAEDLPIQDAAVRYAPEGLGPIPPAWLPRRKFGGTFDENWKEHVWPNWPDDYDFSYHNSAHPDLIYPGFLNGDEVIDLDGLDFAGQRTIRLPGHQLMIQAVTTGGAEPPVLMNLDTLVIDITNPDPDEHRVFLSWRAIFDPNAPIEIRCGFATSVQTASAAQEQIQTHGASS